MTDNNKTNPTDHLTAAVKTLEAVAKVLIAKPFDADDRLAQLHETVLETIRVAKGGDPDDVVTDPESLEVCIECGTVYFDDPTAQSDYCDDCRDDRMVFDVEQCPGCGASPGEDPIDGCDHPDGCGAHRAHKEAHKETHPEQYQVADDLIAAVDQVNQDLDDPQTEADGAWVIEVRETVVHKIKIDTDEAGCRDLAVDMATELATESGLDGQAVEVTAKVIRFDAYDQDDQDDQTDLTDDERLAADVKADRKTLADLAPKNAPPFQTFTAANHHAAIIRRGVDRDARAEVEDWEAVDYADHVIHRYHVATISKDAPRFEEVDREVAGLVSMVDLVERMTGSTEYEYLVKTRNVLGLVRDVVNCWVENGLSINDTHDRLTALVDAYRDHQTDPAHLGIAYRQGDDVNNFRLEMIRRGRSSINMDIDRGCILAEFDYGCDMASKVRCRNRLHSRVGSVETVLGLSLPDDAAKVKKIGEVLEATQHVTDHFADGDWAKTRESLVDLVAETMTLDGVDVDEIEEWKEEARDVLELVWSSK